MSYFLKISICLCVCVSVCFRKELVDNGDLSVTEDLKFGGLVLKKHPKSPETFSHRLDLTVYCYMLILNEK